MRRRLEAFGVAWIVLLVGCATVSSPPSSSGRFDRERGAQWARFDGLSGGSPGGGARLTDGRTTVSLEDTYRLTAGEYALRLRGVAVGERAADQSATPMLHVFLRVISMRGDGSAAPVLVQEWAIDAHTQLTTDGESIVWLSAQDAPLLTLRIDTPGDYRLVSEYELRTGPWTTGGDPLMFRGGFRAALEGASDGARRAEDIAALARQMESLWEEYADTPCAVALPGEAPRRAIHEAAASFAGAFFTEGIDYVDAALRPEDRRKCYEHARLVREWFGYRQALDPALSQWFRMTPVRRETPFDWQSSNLITPAVNAPVTPWLEDGTGVVIEPRLDARDRRLRGRVLTAREFQRGGFSWVSLREPTDARLEQVWPQWEE